MLSVISPSSQQFLNTLGDIQSALNSTEQQVGSGLKLNEPSDEPDAVSPVLVLHSQIAMNQTMQSNLNEVQTQVNTGEQAISSSVTLLQQASTLAAEALDPEQTADTRATLGSSVQSILQQMVTNANTSVSGVYVFSGDNSQSPSYQLDSSALYGVDALQSPQNTLQVAGPGGVTFPYSLTAGQIFDTQNSDGTPAITNIFATLNTLSVALANNDTTGIQNSVSNLASASTYLNNQLAFYGETQDRITSALTTAQNDSTNLQSQLGSLEDADMASEITQMQAAQTQMQAALQIQAQMPRSTLFDDLAPPTN